MSDYTKATNFTAKDSLFTGDPSKVVLGTEIDTEYSAIATAIATKADLASPTFTGTVTLPTVAGNRTDSGNITHTGTVTMSSKSMYWAKGSDIASAATLVLGTDGNYFDVTGSTGPITAITVASGMLFMLQFDSTPTLTHHATNLNLPGGANIVAEAGDRLIGFATAANTVHVISYERASGRIVTRTPVATTSGSSQGFTSIPSWVKRITLTLSGVKSNGTAPIVAQLGKSAGLETTNYLGTVGFLINDTNTNTGGTSTGFNIAGVVAATYTFYGQLIFTLMDSSSNTWACSGVVGNGETNIIHFVAGTKALSGTLDRISIVTTDTYTAGSIGLMYE